jgi:hypothetical protein
VTVTIDTVAPTVTSAKLANGTGTAGKADQGDTATFIFSKQLNAASLCSTWTNSGTQTLTNVTATITNNAGNDPLTVSSASCTLNFGSNVVGDYTSVTSTFTNSTITWNPSTNTLTITLGAQATGTTKTGVATKNQVYTVSAAITDIAGSTVSNSPFTDPTKTGF